MMGWQLSTSPVLARVLLLCLLVSRSEACSNPPVIRESDADGSYIFKKEANNNLVLHCDGGDSSVSWVVEGATWHESASVTQEPPNTAIITITDVYVEDTGYFECRANSHCSSKVYVFIDDGAHGFVNPNEIETVQGTTADPEIIIDCRTNKPDTVVFLSKDGVNVNDNRFMFNARIGFVLKNPAVTDSGLYKCHTNNERPDSLIRATTVTVKPGTLSPLSVPSIQAPPNSHFVVGHPFHLECVVPSQLEITFYWMHAGSPVGLKEVKVQNNDRIKKSTYSVSSAKTSDSGSYQCMVKRGINKSDSPLFNVTILESKAPVLNVSSEPLIIYVNETDPLSWKRMVEFYPHHPVLSYNNSRNESISSSGPRVNWTFNSTTGEAWLYIKKVQTSDFGNWTLVAEMGDLRVISRVEIIVFSSPKVQLLVPNSMNPGPVNVSCDVTSYRFVKGSNRTKQTVNISWMLADCVDQSSYCELKPLEIQSEIRASGNQIKATPVVDGSKLQYINSSVTLKCVAKTDTEEDSDEKIILVTDLADPWVFAHCRDDGSVEHFKKLESSINVVVNDNFEVWCNATDILYLPPVLSFSGDVEHKKTIFHGDYSSSSGIRLNVSKALNGTKFTCSVTHKGSNTVEVKSLEVVVEDEKPITLSASSNTKLDVIPEDYRERGTNYTIICEPEAKPMPRIKWLKDGEDIHFNRTIMHFDYLEPEDEGTYTCLMSWRRREYKASLALYISDPRASAIWWVLGIAGAFIIILIGAATSLVLRLKREKAKSEQRKAARRILFQTGKIDEINAQLMVEDQADLLPYDTSFEVPRDRIKIGRQLGSGAFGRVVKAEVFDLNDDGNYSPVAIKMTKSMSDASHVKSLAIELKIMIYLGKHLNIVNLIGANTQNIDKDELWLLVEYCQYGDLLSFIHRYRKKFVDQIDPVTDEINYSFMAVTPNCYASPFSPGVNNYKKRDRPSECSEVPSPGGYMVPQSLSKPIVLADPPKGHSARSSRDTSPQSTPFPSSAAGPENLLVGNPGYGVLSTFVNQEPPTPGSDSQCPASPPPTVVPPDVVPPPTPPSFTAPYVNMGVVQSAKEEVTQSHNTDVFSSPTSPPPYVTQSFTPNKSPRRHDSTSSNVFSNSYRSGSMTGPYRRYNTDMTTVSSAGRPFSPADVWLDSQGNPINNDGTAIPGLGHPFTTTEIICWSWQVAQGMEYLTRRKILHGDLAARNLLLAEGNIVKISDFGLSRDMYKKEIYTKQGDDLLPIKWMSIEAIRDRMFSTQSDIWAYGIVLWELFSLGMAPYPGVDVNPKFLSDLENGMRNAKPKYSNGIIYELMEDCWIAEPSDRPSFSEILARLDHLLHDDVRENFEKLNEEYDRSNQNYFAGRTDYLSMFSSPDFNNLQKAENDECRYFNMEDMTDQERQKASEYLSMRKSSYADQGEVPGYLSMKTFSEHHPSPPPPPPATDPVDIFSPNPRDTSLPNGSRFTFHSSDDLPRTEILYSPTPSSVSSCYVPLLQTPSPTDGCEMGEDKCHGGDDEGQDINTLLPIPEDDCVTNEDSFATPKPDYCNMRV
ncbi:vascular endothelial growth factor receptor 1 isoform X4 [Hyalella azteca]|uniref:Vascular endothelial growth factor receptor 1 isoform X4 n=1 Tax=Hyalella azteca TaxID=294128 RepID=A0A8B7P5D0_HYAAZ|nr:vascular endothelial growth factor receptor 1 isoform X4 [Hyalella azteca]